MILDKLQYLRRYESIHHRFKVAMDYLEHQDLKNAPDGRHPIAEDDVFAIVQSYDTKPSELCILEGHRKYIDIQFMIVGSESMGFETLTHQTVREVYDDSKDIAFFEGVGSLIRVDEGSFTIFFPNDLHRPCVAIGTPQRVKKVVVKIRVD